MPIPIRAALFLCAGLLAATSVVAGAQGTAQPKPAAAQEAQGKDVLQRKCFQCHAAGMWTSLRQDRKEWESTLWRMVGRGALWTEAEVAAMADFLAQTRGPVK